MPALGRVGLRPRPAIEDRSLTDQRNMILAIVLSALVLFGWSALSERFFPTAQAPVTRIDKGREVVIPKLAADPAADAPAAIRARGVVLRETPRVRIITPQLAGSINLKGARIDDLVLTRQRETIDANSPAIRLLSPGGAKGAYFAGFGWAGAGTQAPGQETLWTPSARVLTPAAPVTLSWANGAGQRFDILIAVDADYMFTVRQRVSNASPAPVAVQPFALINRDGKSPDVDSWTMHTGPVGVFNGSANYDVNFDDLDEGSADGQKMNGRGGWLGFTDKYWLTALVPDQRSAVEGTFRRGRQGSYQADFTTPTKIVAPGQALTQTSHLFAGAKELRALDKYEASLGVPAFDKAIDWGWFEWFAKPIFYLLNWLFSVAGNFGVAIILLTIIVRGLMYPIAQKQFQSMAAMRLLQPKMKALQDRYKDDKPRQQQEIMKLYKDEKVNPLAGCAPILLQIPVFYALYKVLMLAVEMRHEPFILWLRDLTAPDPMTPVNLFGYLPFTPPQIIAIGVLPILVGITQYVTFKLNPPATDPVQQKVFSLMPWFLMVIMAPFAAGLQLYWMTNNIFTIIQQKLLYKRYGVDMKAPATT